MPAIIAALVSALLAGLRYVLPHLVGRLLLALGIGLAVNKLVLPDLMNYIQNSVQGMPGVISAYFRALGLDVFCSLVLSAMVTNSAAKVFLKKL